MCRRTLIENNAALALITMEMGVSTPLNFLIMLTDTGPETY